MHESLNLGAALIQAFTGGFSDHVPTLEYQDFQNIPTIQVKDLIGVDDARTLLIEIKDQGFIGSLEL